MTGDHKPQQTFSGAIRAGDQGDGDANLDLGFGSVVSAESRQRLLNRDGTFNVLRKGLARRDSLSLYHLLLEITWPQFLVMAGLFYLALNLAFATAFLALGPDAIAGGAATTLGDRFWEAFFLSVYTASTVGYGNLVPVTWAANVLMTIEALAGLLSFGLVSGLMFARFARPTARILFSEPAVIAPYGDGDAFEFRIINRRKTQISDLQARVIFARRRPSGVGRSYVELDLERGKVAFFPLAWTIVHPIDEQSPLYGLTSEELTEHEAEFLVLLQGYDDTFAQVVHARSSYRADEVVYRARFADMFDHGAGGGEISVDVGRLHDIERV
jgi:inward rectifier potassium channel